MKVFTEEGLRPIKNWASVLEDAAFLQAKNLARLPFIAREGVALMPDAHSGKGSTIGSVIATEKAIIPAAVGVDLGCFTGDTVVRLADGRSVSLADMLTEYLAGAEHYVYCVDADSAIKIAKVSAVTETRKVKTLALVTLDNGEIIKCTTDHQYKLRDGSFVPASDLKPDTALMPLYLDRSSTENIDEVTNAHAESLDYDIVYDPATSSWVMCHHLSDEYNKRTGNTRVPEESSWCRHHVDFNKFNNDPLNVIRVGRVEHRKIHSDALSETNKLGITGWGAAHAKNPEFFSNMSSVNLSKLHNRPDFAARARIRASKSISELNKNPTENMLLHREKIAKLGASRFAEQNQNDSSTLFRTISKIKKYAEFLVALGITDFTQEAWDAHRKETNLYNVSLYSTAVAAVSVAGVSLYDLLDEHKFATLRSSLSYRNHKVVSVEIVEYENEIPVYCLTVPEFGNFGLAAGVIVKNCGMNAVRLSIKASDLPDSLAAIRSDIERDVPMGGNGSHSRADAIDMSGGYLSANPMPEKVASLLGSKASKAATQLGTLGSGNHFIELCLDENQDVWIMLHSGSRGVGNLIGTYFIEKAKSRMEQYFITLPDGDLAYLPEDTDDFAEYVEAVDWAQNYALENRRRMMAVVIAVLQKHITVPFTVTQEGVNCHHNYVERENHFGRNMWVTRKGAIRAREGDLGVIPGSMGQKSYVVRGKGNTQSYCSCSHGSGRVMSRSKARKTFSLQDLVEQTQGVECRKDDGVLDEIPGAYKDIDQVMADQTDLIEVLHTLKQVMCVKG